MFIEISKKYDEIYHKRYKLWKTGRIWSKANEWYPEFSDLISSQEWSDLREVAACFELIGILVKKGYIDREVLFGFVRVNIPAVPHPGELTL
jgi:hypothetical protein